MTSLIVTHKRNILILLPSSKLKVLTLYTGVSLVVNFQKTICQSYFIRVYLSNGNR